MDFIGFFDEQNRPKIKAVVCFGKKCKEYNFLIDSGADISIIPRKVGIELGLKLPRKPEGFSLGIGGRSPNVVVELRLKFKNLVLKIPFVWLYQEPDVPVILGRKGLFDYFDVEFQQRKGKVIFKH